MDKPLTVCIIGCVTLPLGAYVGYKVGKLLTSIERSLKTIALSTQQQHIRSVEEAARSTIAIDNLRQKFLESRSFVDKVIRDINAVDQERAKGMYEEWNEHFIDDNLD